MRFVVDQKLNETRQANRRVDENTRLHAHDETPLEEIVCTVLRPLIVVSSVFPFALHPRFHARPFWMPLRRPRPAASRVRCSSTAKMAWCVSVDFIGGHE